MTAAPWPDGFLTAMLTPLSGDELDVPRIKYAVERQVSAGVDGIVIAGGTGEFGALSLEERKLLATASIDAAAGRIPVVVQTGALASRDCYTLSEHAQALGALGLLVTAPFGEPLNWPEKVHFYEGLARRVDLPIMIYNTPAAGLLSFEQVQELAAIPNVSAIKDSAGDMALLGDLSSWSSSARFQVYVGIDSLLWEGIAGGARGAIFGTGNVIPELLSALTNNLLAEEASASDLDRWRAVRRFMRYMERTSNYVSFCKAGARAAGFDVGDVRDPYLMPDASESELLRQRIHALRDELASISAGSQSTST